MQSTLADLLGIVEQARGLGSLVLANGTQLIGHVPHIAVEGYLHEIYPGLSGDQILLLERSLANSVIPQEYKSFLGVMNGATLFSGALWFGGYRRDYSRTGDDCRQPYGLDYFNVLARPRDARNGEFFIGGFDDEHGSLLYLREGLVFRCSRASSRPAHEWVGFWDMLSCETVRISKLFDSFGRLKGSDSAASI